MKFEDKDQEKYQEDLQKTPKEVGGFHHSIVGNIEIFGDLLHSDTISIFDYLWFLLLALLGNGIGGFILVAFFKYRIFQSNYLE
jgi:formate/nitrite transporter FocA (FNT family)